MALHQSGQLLRSAPYFPVADVARSVAFYEQVLGFRCEYSAGTPLQLLRLRFEDDQFNAFFVEQRIFIRVVEQIVINISTHG